MQTGAHFWGISIMILGYPAHSYRVRSSGIQKYVSASHGVKVPHCRSYMFTYLPVPCSRVLLEKLTDSQLIKKFPAFYGTRISITAFTGVGHLSLS